MYKPSTEPIRCPKCGAIVKVTAIRFPDIEWKCLMCGESGSIKQCATSGYIQKVSEPNPGVGVTTTNADDITTIDITPAIYSTNTKCTICGEEFKFDGEHRICPKCREAVVKLRNPKSTACDIPVKPILQQGWECPKCGAILAPNQHYCPFCSPSEYGRTNWLGTNTPTSGQYMNPNPSTTISKVTQ